MTSNVEKIRRFYITAETSTHEREKLRALFSTDLVSLLVVDCPFNGDWQNIYLFHRTNDIGRELDTLPTHEESVARIFDYSCKFEVYQLDRLREHFKNVYRFSKGIPDVTWGYATSVYDLDNIASQWSLDFPDWLKAEDRFSPRWQHERPAHTYLKCQPIEKNRLLVFHRLPEEEVVPLSAPPGSLSALDCFLARHLLEKDASISMADGTRTHFSKMLVLDFLRGCLSGWIDTVYPHYLSDVTDRFLRFGRPPASGIVEEYVEKFLQYEKIMEHAQDLIDAVEFILQTLAPTALNASTHSPEHRMREIMVRIRFKCAQLSKLISRILERRDRRYELFMKNLRVEDSISIKRLTILVAIFLPLSLASSILCMQTRFVNLHLLLYDFLGIFLLIASFAVVTYFIVQVFTPLSRRDYLKLSAKYERWKFNWGRNKSEMEEVETSLKLLLKYTVILCVWAITITSFIVGMALDVTLGLRILGYGLAALVGTGFPLVVLTGCWLFGYHFPRTRTER